MAQPWEAVEACRGAVYAAAASYLSVPSSCTEQQILGPPYITL